MHCIFSYTPRWGKFPSKILQFYTAINAIQSPSFVALPEFHINVAQKTNCTWVTIIRCDADDVLTERYVSFAISNANFAYQMETPQLTGIYKLHRPVVDWDNSSQSFLCYSSKTNLYGKPYSLGLTITVPAIYIRQMFKTPHTDTVNVLRSLFNATQITLIPGNNLAYAPITRASGHFPWGGVQLPWKKCKKTAFPVSLESALQRLQNFNIKDACGFNVFLKGTATCN